MPSISPGRSRLRVLLLLYQDTALAGGALRVGESIAGHLDPARFEPVLVFAYGGPGPVAAGSQIPVVHLGAAGSRDLGAWPRARRTIGRLRPDVLHFVDQLLWLQLATFGLPAVRLRHVHGRFLPVHRESRTAWIQRLTRRLVDGHVCITHGARRTLVEYGWAAEGRAWTVANGVDATRFGDLPEPSAARRRLGLPVEAHLLGMACRLVVHRGCQDGIEILARLPATWHLVLAGDGPFRPDLEELARARGLVDRVHFLGLLDDVRPVYAALDAYLFAARYDSFGLATAEAMAAGVPVFGLGADGEYREPEDPLVTPDNALFVERAHPTDADAPEDPANLEALAAEIEAFGRDPAPARARAAIARAWVTRRFGAQRQADALARLYERLRR